MGTPILIVGAGKMGTALIRGWTRVGLGPITAVEPNPSDALKETCVKIVPALDAVPVGKWRAAVVALKPHIVRTEAAKLETIASTGTLMISIAAGTDTALLHRAWGENASIVRVMPNTPGAIGKGVSGLYAVPGVSAADREFAQTLIASIGQTVWLDEETMIDAVTAVSGSGPAYIFAVVEALAKAGEAAGLPSAVAARLARATVTGAGALLEADTRDVAALIRDVATPGGTTEAALKHLQAANGLPDVIARAVAAAKARAEELARG
jgi:pyrroline-5-carboxylate reductase